MGCCHSDIVHSAICSDNQCKSKEVLQFMKAIAMRFVDTGSYPLAVKAIHARNITKSYYKKTSSQRKSAIRLKERFTSEQIEELNNQLEKEKRDLNQALVSVEDLFSSLTKKYLVYSPSVDSYIEKFRENDCKMSDYKGLKEKCERFERNKEGIDKLSANLNDGKALNDTEKGIIKRLCTHTSHLANDTRNRSNYVFKYQCSTITRERRVNTYACDVNLSAFPSRDSTHHATSLDRNMLTSKFRS